MIKKHLAKTIVGLLVLSLLAVPFLGVSEPVVYYLSVVMIYSIFALGFDLVFGVAGLLSLGHSAFFGLGAYTLTLLSIHFHLPFGLGMFAGGLVSASLAMLFGLIAVRLSALFFAMTTLALAELIHIFFTYKWREVTGGPDGLSGVPRPDFWGIDFYQNNNFFLFLALLFLLALVVSAVIRSSPFGQVLRGMEQNDVRAAQIGFNLKRFKLGVFVLSGFLSGVSGCLLASLMFFTDSSNLSFEMSVSVVIMTLLGGAGTLLGPVFGVVLFEFLREVLSSYTEYWAGIIGIVFIIYTIFLPKGMVGLAKAGIQRLTSGRKGV